MSTEQERLLLRETIEAGFRQAPFVSDVGITLVDCGPGWCESGLTVTPRHFQHGGVVHAGVQATMADLPAPRLRRNKSFAPIGQTTTVPIVLVAGPKVKATDIKGLVAEVKANPGKYTFGSAGNGSSNHLVGEMFNAGLKLDMMHVPYKGDGPAMTDVMAGRYP